MLLETLMRRLGAQYGRLRDFKRDLRQTLEDFVERGWIHGYRFSAGVDGELLAIENIPTPSQRRAIERRRGGDSDTA